MTPPVDPQVRTLARDLAGMVDDDGAPRPGTILERLLRTEPSEQWEAAAALHRHARTLLGVQDPEAAWVLKRLAASVDLRPGVAEYIERLAAPPPAAEAVRRPTAADR